MKEKLISPEEPQMKLMYPLFVYMIILCLISCGEYDTDDFQLQVGRDMENLSKNGLPIVVINTPDAYPVASKDDYVSGSNMTLFRPDLSYEYQGEVKIKGHGNTTWRMPKKPYKIKFGRKQSLLGEPRDTEWLLLANYYDSSMLRGEVAFWMASSYGKFDYVPRCHFVDLVLNDKYKGTYQLAENVKVAKSRVNVGDNGYLLEIDAKATVADITFRVPHIGQPIRIAEPYVVVGDKKYNFVVDYVSRADAALFADNWLDAGNGYKTLIDMQSFVEWYLMMEITKNNDAVFFTSCYMNLARDGKLKMGPIWDFDLSMGGYLNSEREFVNDPEGFYIKTETGSWIARLFEDPAFVEAVKTRFDAYYENKEAIVRHIDSIAGQNRQSAILNNKIWGTLCDKNKTDAEVEAAYYGQITYLKHWLSTRLEWLKAAYGAM